MTLEDTRVSLQMIDLAELTIQKVHFLQATLLLDYTCYTSPDRTPETNENLEMLIRYTLEYLKTAEHGYVST